MPLSEKESARLQSADLPFAERILLSELAAFAQSRPREFLDRFIAVFRVLRSQNLLLFSDSDLAYFTELFSLWFKVLENSSFQFQSGDEELFLLGDNIHNILALTYYQNGDACIRKIHGKPGSLAKLLLLNSPRSRLDLPVKKFFDNDPMLASLWYANVWNWVDTYVDPTVASNCRKWLRSFDSRFELVDYNIGIGSFRSTYIDHKHDRIFKRQVNQAISKSFAGLEIANDPDPRSLALISANWTKGHAVYRAFPLCQGVGGAL